MPGETKSVLCPQAQVDRRIRSSEGVLGGPPSPRCCLAASTVDGLGLCLHRSPVLRSGSRAGSSKD